MRCTQLGWIARIVKANVPAYPMKVRVLGAQTQMLEAGAIARAPEDLLLAGHVA